MNDHARERAVSLAEAVRAAGSGEAALMQQLQHQQDDQLQVGWGAVGWVRAGDGALRSKVAARLPALHVPCTPPASSDQHRRRPHWYCRRRTSTRGTRSKTLSHRQAWPWGRSGGRSCRPLPPPAAPAAPPPPPRPPAPPALHRHRSCPRDTSSPAKRSATACCCRSGSCPARASPCAGALQGDGGWVLGL